MGFFVAATWQFSGKGVQTAAECLARGKDIMDALESGIGAVEDDPEVLSVGLGGYPNCQGECELDAGIMDGRTLATGAVLGLKGFPHPISVARKLLEETPHTAVAGAGADAFAYEHGFERRQVFHRRAYDRWFDIREQYISSGALRRHREPGTGRHQERQRRRPQPRHSRHDCQGRGRQCGGGDLHQRPLAKNSGAHR